MFNETVAPASSARAIREPRGGPSGAQGQRCARARRAPRAGGRMGGRGNARRAARGGSLRTRASSLSGWSRRRCGLVFARAFGSGARVRPGWLGTNPTHLPPDRLGMPIAGALARGCASACAARLAPLLASLTLGALTRGRTRPAPQDPLTLTAVRHSRGHSDHGAGARGRTRARGLRPRAARQPWATR